MNTAYFKLSRMLEKYHAIFYKIWELGEPNFTESIPRAGITFNPIRFHFNPTFFSQISDEEKCFFIAHEAMHAILNHGERLLEASIVNSDAVNVAMDISLHEIMFNNMGFDESFKDANICTRENTCPKADPNESAEYYYNYLIDNDIQIPKRNFDTHLFKNGNASKELQKIVDQLSNEDITSLKNILEDSKEGKEAGSKAGENSLTLNIKPIRKKKWESIITHWLKEEYIEEEQWAIPHRRIPNSLLPYDYDKLVNGTVDVVFYQDTSGSCKHLAERFFKAAKSLPQSFNVHLFCFDTQVYNIKDDILQGFGGTDFQILSDHLDKMKFQKHPTVFVMTDGYGTNITCKKPSMWHWFLSEDYRFYIPKQSKVHMLKDYE